MELKRTTTMQKKCSKGTKNTMEIDLNTKEIKNNNNKNNKSVLGKQK